jgi:HK97 gp10 family phage protein
MINSSVAWDDRAFQAAFKQELQRLKIAATNALFRVGNQVLNDIKRNTPVDTGRARSAYVSSQGSDGLGSFVRISNSVTYVPYLEYGTSRMAARPHFRPAIQKAPSMLASELRRIGR